MKAFIISCLLSVGTLSGCATVSMIPGQTIIETSLTTEQSALRAHSDAYVKMAETSRWVPPNPDFWDFARMLATGDAQPNAPKTYAEHVFEIPYDPAQVGFAIAADIDQAKSGLLELIEQAEIVLADQSKELSLRADTYSFESALVIAQKARRQFDEAVYLLNKQSASSIAEFTEHFGAFDAVIERAQTTADALAMRAAGETDAEASA